MVNFWSPILNFKDMLEIVSNIISYPCILNLIFISHLKFITHMCSKSFVSQTSQILFRKG